VRLGARVDIVLRLAFTAFEFGLTAVSRFDRIGPGLDFTLLQKIAPAGVAVFGTLACFEFLYRDLGRLLAADNLDYTSGLIGADVVADDGVRKCRFVARCQKTPVCGRNSGPGADRPGWKHAGLRPNAVGYMDYTPFRLRGLLALQAT